jgi:hypothetical protein
VLGCDVLGVCDGAGATVPAPPDGDGGGAAVCALLEIVRIRKHVESSATTNQFLFGFISHTPNSNFVLLEMYGVLRRAGIRWTTYADSIDRVQTIFTDTKKIACCRVDHVAALGVKDALFRILH